MIKKFFLFILFFCWISPLSFSFFPISSGNLSALIFLGYIFLEILNKSLNKIYFNIAITALFVAIYYSSITTFNGNNDYSLTYLLFLHVVQYAAGAYFFYDLFKKNHIKIETICYYLVFSGLILSISSILSYLSYEFKLFLSEILPQAGNIDPLRLNRVRGLSNSGGADHSMQLAICGLGYIYFYISTNKIVHRIILLSLYSILMFSTMFIARTGFLVEMLALIFAIIFFDRNKVSTLFILFSAISIAIFSILTFLPLIDYITNDVFSNETLPWFISLFSIVTDGKLNDSNVDLLQMLYLPDDFFLLLFGTGGYEFFLNYNRSDSGYVKFIFSVGLINSLLFVSFVFYSAFKLFNARGDSLFFGVLSIFIFLAIALNIKEPFLIKIGTVNMVYLSLFFAWCSTPFNHSKKYTLP